MGSENESTGMLQKEQYWLFRAKQMASSDGRNKLLLISVEGTYQFLRSCKDVNDWWIPRVLWKWSFSNLQNCTLSHCVFHFCCFIRLSSVYLLVLTTSQKPKHFTPSLALLFQKCVSMQSQVEEDVINWTSKSILYNLFAITIALENLVLQPDLRKRNRPKQSWLIDSLTWVC